MRPCPCQVSNEIILAGIHALEPPESHLVTEQEGDFGLTEEQRRGEAEKHPLLIWTGLTAGDVVSLRAHGTRDYVVGTVESSSSDGLNIWIRDDLNERRHFHFHDCQSVLLVR